MRDKPAPLPEWAHGYFRAFWALTGDRGYATDISVVNNVPLAMARPLPIPFMAIECYGTRFEYIGQSFMLLVRFVRALDAEYLKVMAEMAKGQVAIPSDDQDDNT
jgi:hypothetical protein